MPRCPSSFLRVVLLGLLVFSGAHAGAAAPVRLGVLTDNYPFCFREADGRFDGFAYELAAEIESSMGLKFERVGGPTNEIHEGFLTGRIDAVLTYADFAERKDFADFSFPYLTMTGAIVVRDDEQRIRSFADLKGRRVFVHRGSLGDTLLHRAGLGDSAVYVASVEQALVRLNAGEGDATLVTRLSGLSVAHRFGLKRVRALDVPVEGYEVRYCFAVHKGDRELLAKINEGLAVLVRTGRFDRLYRKWFGSIEPAGYTVEEVMLAVAVGLALALAIAIWAVIRQRGLRQRIAQQAEALRASEELYRGMFEGSRTGLVLFSRGGAGPVPEQINPAARRLLGLDPAEPLSGSVEALLAFDAAFAARIRASLEAGVLEEFEQAVGDRGWWRVFVSPLDAHTLFGFTDITEAVKARQQLQVQEEHLRQHQKLEAVGTLAGGVAHDFNNLLTAILGNTELVLFGLDPASEEAEQLRHVVQASRRARDLVRQILTFSRRTAPSREVLALEPVVHETIALLRTLAKGAVTFEVQFPPDLPLILADPVQVHQVIMNIGTNAVQAMRGTPGKLLFAAEAVHTGPELREQFAALQPGYYVRLGVRDTGPGMTPEIQRRIFEPFFTTKSPGEGTGLGLSVVHGIMHQHGGAVTLYSQPGRGTLFHLYFPVTEETQEVPRPPAIAATADALGSRVLLIDDDPVIVDTARKMLGHLGLTVSAHARADTAWAEWSASPDAFALIVSDLAMPGINGLQLLARVRAVRPAQPFLLISGFFSDTEAAEARDRLVTGLVPKPLSNEVLARAVADALQRRPA